MQIRSILRRLTGSTEKKIDVDTTVEVADLLSNKRRVQVLVEMDSATDGSMSMCRLADKLARREHGSEYESSDRKKKYISLYQTHVPRLDAVNVVDWDQDSGIITRGPRFGELFTALNGLQK